MKIRKRIAAFNINKQDTYILSVVIICITNFTKRHKLPVVCQIHNTLKFNTISGAINIAVKIY